jgi:hypothetical protein
MNEGCSVYLPFVLVHPIINHRLELVDLLASDHQFEAPNYNLSCKKKMSVYI